MASVFKKIRLKDTKMIILSPYRKYHVQEAAIYVNKMLCRLFQASNLIKHFKMQPSKFNSIEFIMYNFIMPTNACYFINPFT